MSLYVKVQRKKAPLEEYFIIIYHFPQNFSVLPNYYIWSHW